MENNIQRLFCHCVLVLLLALTTETATAGTLDEVRTRGFVKCGVTNKMQGFSERGEDGVWSGFNADYCRAVASATMGSAEAVEFLPFWIDALKGKEVDVLIAGSTWTLSRETTDMVQFTGTNFYDGQGFIAHASLGAHNASDVTKATVCAVQPTATSAANLTDYIAAKGLAWEVVPFQTLEAVWSSFIGRRCDMATHDRTALVSMHMGRTSNPEDYVVFPDVISKEPLSPAVRKGDIQWFDIVRWVTFATISAEELGITQANVDEMLTSDVPEVRRLLGVEGDLGPSLGLKKDWAYRIIKDVGNYGEIFERTLGKNSPYKMERGVNTLWKDGGLLYAPPFR